jgi:hypothetical protein
MLILLTLLWLVKLKCLIKRKTKAQDLVWHHGELSIKTHTFKPTGSCIEVNFKFALVNKNIQKNDNSSEYMYNVQHV